MHMTRLFLALLPASLIVVAPYAQGHHQLLTATANAKAAK
jgi:hypothetical protein